MGELLPCTQAVAGSNPVTSKRGIKMGRWIKERWEYIAGVAAMIGLFVLLVVSINLLVTDFNEAGGFHRLAVLIGKEVKEIAKEIDED